MAGLVVLMYRVLRCQLHAPRHKGTQAYNLVQGLHQNFQLNHAVIHSELICGIKIVQRRLSSTSISSETCAEQLTTFTVIRPRYPVSLKRCASCFFLAGTTALVLPFKRPLPASVASIEHSPMTTLSD